MFGKLWRVYLVFGKFFKSYFGKNIGQVLIVLDGNIPTLK